MIENNDNLANSGFIQTDGPSLAHIQHAIQRFKIVNKGRLERLKESLQPKQKQCFDLIPLLFHYNHESLPGYVEGEDTPIGISNFVPSDEIMKVANSITRGKLNRQLTATKAQLSAIYLMGSSGTVGHSTTSDLDIWVCYDATLTTRQIHALTIKFDRITQWADDFNLEVHFFPMNAHRFHGGEQQSLTGENCGSTQHVLLLDEFYRTAQLLAGTIPAWWLVPSNHEEKYDQTVQSYYDQGYLTESECTDFGGISSLLAGEFIGAGMWQIYKAIDSPYKSVLKLILLEIYARQFPKIDSLAHSYKDAVYKMQLSLDDLDPYIMLYRRIESYLVERDERTRLELIRRCFYFKVGVNLSKPTRTLSWRRDLMDFLVHSWGWNSKKIKHLDNFRSWDIDDVIKERRLLVSELTNSYRFLTEFSSEHHSSHLMSQRDLLILSRKLHTAFDRRPGKIDFIQTGLDVDLSHEKIRLYERESKQEPGVYLWAAYNQSLDEASNASPLKYSKGLLETLLWTHLNGLISAHLHIPVYPTKDQINEYELRATLASMRQYIPVPMPKIESTNYYHPAYLTKVILFINLGCDPLKRLSARGLQKISARSNSLDYSASRENLVASLDAVLINSWGEVVVERFVDSEATPKAIKSLVNRIQKQSHRQAPIIETVCHNQTRPQAIAKRVKELFLDALETLCSTELPENSRFIFNISNQFLLFQYINRVTNYTVIDNYQNLIEMLSNEQEQYSPVIFDRHFNEVKSVVAELYKQQSQHSLTLGFEIIKDDATLYLIDEYGSLISYSQTFHNLATFLSPIIRFLKVTEHRQRSGADAQLMPERQVNCFQVVREKGNIKLEKTKLSGLINKGRFISIQVTVDISESGQYSYFVVCNEKEFSSTVNGSQWHKAIASYILGMRASGQKYPTYITDLAMTEAVMESLPYGHDQTLHYLQMKLKLERKINDAMSLI